MVTSDHSSRHRLVRASRCTAMSFRYQQVPYSRKDINKPIVVPFVRRLKGLPLNMNRAAGTSLTISKKKGLSIEQRPP